MNMLVRVGGNISSRVCSQKPAMPIGQPTQLFINGEFVNSVSGKTFVSHNPANEQVGRQAYCQ